MITPIATIPTNIPVISGNKIKIPILLINAVDFTAIDLTLKYDSNILELPNSNNLVNPNITTGPLTQNFQIYSDVKPDLGIVKLAFIPSVSINNTSQNTGIIAELEFTVKENLNPDLTAILDLQEVKLDEKSITINDGSIIVSNEPPKSELVSTFFDAITDHVIDANTSVNFTVLNQGIATSENFQVEVYYSEDEQINPQEDTLITTKNYEGLAVGQILDESLPISIPKNELNLSANTDDPVNLGKNHQSLNSDYLGIIINDNSLTEENGINTDDITYFPWDVNKDGKITPTDALFAINRLGQTISNENQRADLNLDQQISIEDVNAVSSRLGYSINNTVFNN